MADFRDVAANWLLEIVAAIIAGQGALLLWLVRRGRDPEPDPEDQEDPYLAQRLHDQEIEIAIRHLREAVEKLQGTADYLVREVAFLKGHYKRSQQDRSHKDQLS